MIIIIIIIVVVRIRIIPFFYSFLLTYPCLEKKKQIIKKIKGILQSVEQSLEQRALYPRRKNLLQLHRS